MDGKLRRRPFLCCLYGQVNTCLTLAVLMVAMTYYDFVAMALDDCLPEASLIDPAECGYQFSEAMLNSLLAPVHSQ